MAAQDGHPAECARKILWLLGPAYAHCERAEFLLIVLDALDQAGAPLSVQDDVFDRIADWDADAVYEAKWKWLLALRSRRDAEVQP